MRQPPDPQAFDQRLQAVEERPYVLQALIAINVVIWLACVAMSLQGPDAISEPSPEQLFHWGGLAASAVFKDGEYWRLLSATFLHASWLHIGMNMLVLWVFGRYTLQWYGNLQFLLLYLGSALAGSALSLSFAAQQQVSVGASGAILGVMAAVVAGLLQHRQRVPEATFWRLMQSVGVYLILVVVEGFRGEAVDNAAHVGGVLAGAVMAWLLVEKIEATASPARRRQGRRHALLAVAAGTLGLVLSAPAPSLDMRIALPERKMMADAAERIRHIELELQQALDDPSVTDAAFRGLVEGRYLPGLRQLQVDLNVLRLSPGSPFGQVRDSLLLYLAERLVYLDKQLRLATSLAGAETDRFSTEIEQHRVASARRAEQLGNAVFRVR